MLYQSKLMEFNSQCQNSYLGVQEPAKYRNNAIPISLSINFCCCPNLVDDTIQNSEVTHRASMNQGDATLPKVTRWKCTKGRRG